MRLRRHNFDRKNDDERNDAYACDVLVFYLGIEEWFLLFLSLLLTWSQKPDTIQDDDTAETPFALWACPKGNETYALEFDVRARPKRQIQNEQGLVESRQKTM